MTDIKIAETIYMTTKEHKFWMKEGKVIEPTEFSDAEVDELASVGLCIFQTDYNRQEWNRKLKLIRSEYLVYKYLHHYVAMTNPEDKRGKGLAHSGMYSYWNKAHPTRNDFRGEKPIKKSNTTTKTNTIIPNTVEKEFNAFENRLENFEDEKRIVNDPMKKLDKIEVDKIYKKLDDDYLSKYGMLCEYRQEAVNEEGIVSNEEEQHEDVCKDDNDFFDVKTKPPVKVVMSKNKIAISKEDAERSADEWIGYGESLMRNWLVNAIMDPKQHRDIGKVLAYVAEIHVNKWLSEKTGRPIKTVVGESYDGKTDDDKVCVRHQIKFRMNVWHLETTRRNSKKNIKTNRTGHVAYKNDEFDMIVIFKPSPTFGIIGSSIRCIPVSVLINPQQPDQLITTINANIRKLYDCSKKTDEVIQLLYQTQSLHLD